MDPRRIVILLLLALGLSGCVTKENYNTQVLRTNNFQRLLSEEEKRTVEMSTEIARLKDQMSSMETKNKALTAQLNDSKAQVVRSLEEVGRLQDEVKQSRGGFSSAPALRGPSQEPPDRLGELQERPAAPSEKKGDKKKGKAEAKVKVQKQSEAPPPAQPKVAPPAPMPSPPFEPLLREPSQEPPDRLGELQAAPAVKSEKKVEKPAEKPVARQKGKATAKIRVQKQSEEPSSPPPQVEAPPPPAKAEAKAKAQATPETEAIPDDSFFRYHKVKKGETLAGIAKQYRTDAQTLRELNDMASGDAVRPGDRLIVGQKQ